MLCRRLLPAAFAALFLTSLALLPQDQKPSGAKKKKGLPLKPERKVEFTTTEGTWLSLDVSPDGKQIIFELLGDIYTLPIEGGEAKPLLTGMAFDSQPRYSPDGKRIAFLSDREGAENLWIANADGSDSKQLSKEQHTDFASPSWTPDGEFVLVSRASPASRTNEIWMYSVRGGTGVQVTKATSRPEGASGPPSPMAPRMNALGAVASPDGRLFYYARRTGMFSYNANFPLWQIVRRDRVTGDEDAITREYGSAFRPLLSPDGRKLVYGTRLDAQTGLRIRDLATGEDHMLKYPVQRDDQESIASRDLLPGYAFTPDGRDLVLNYGGKIHRVSVTTGEDRVIPFSAKVSQDLGPKLYFPARVDEGPVKVRLIQGPEQSPGGRRIAFSALTHLYISDGPRNPHRLTTSAGGEYLPAWSPDGQWIAYVTWGPQGGQIFKTRADGQGAPQQLTQTAAFYRDPVWSPDGSRMVALRAATRERLEANVDFGNLPGMDVIWIPSSGGETHLIVPARGVGGPHFGPEPERVYFYSGQAGLLSMRYDGTDRRVLVKVVGKSPGPEPAPATDVRISPKGDLALALVFNQLYVLAVPRIGGDPPTINVNSASVPVKKLTDAGADYFNWADNGQTITWALGASFFRQQLSTVSFEPEKKPAGEADKKEAEEEPKKPEAQSLAEEIAIDIDAPRHKPQGVTVLRGAQVITMKGDEVVPNGDIVITDNRITAVGRRGSVTVPKGARIIDLKGATIMPGIVDVHAHWTEVRRRVLDTQVWPFLANLAYGVTTGRDPQTMTNDMFAYQDLVDTGDVLGPRAYSTGPGVFSMTDFQSAAEARHVVEKYTKYYRTRTLKSYVVGNRQQREWVVQACKELGIMPTTEGKLDLKLDLTHAIDGFEGNEHALPIVPLYDDVVEMFAKSGIHYTPTLLVAYGGPWAENYFYETTEVHENVKLRRFFPHEILDEKSERRPWFRYNEHVFPKLAESAAKIARAGGHVQVGGHGQIQGIQCHWEMWALASGGLTPHEVLRIATLNGAEAIGLAQDLGSIEPGKLADLMVLNKDPLQDIHNTAAIRYVMKNGELFDGDTLDEIWPQQKKLPPMWWQGERP